ncbi:hypothetical protein CYMTET_28027, partial [Cymbomonas tetramitiformis]
KLTRCVLKHCFREDMEMLARCILSIGYTILKPCILEIRKSGNPEIRKSSNPAPETEPEMLQDVPEDVVAHTASRQIQAAQTAGTGAVVPMELVTIENKWWNIEASVK